MNVLLVRTSALGDVVHTLPVLGALRRAWPTARIGWVVEEAFAELLYGHPWLDEVISVRLRPWRRRPLSESTREGIATVTAALRAFSADLALDLMGSWKGAALARLSRAGRVRGARRADRREPSSALWIDDPVEVVRAHAVERALAILPTQIPRGPVDFGGPLLPGAGGEEAADRVLIQPGAGWGSKRWPAERWGGVAARLAAEGFPVRVLAGPGEGSLAAAVVEASGGAARPLDPGPLPRLVGALRAARLVLGGDTGPLHLAHALGTPVLMVMGPTDPARHGPWGAPDRALVHRLPCSFCYRRFSEPKACLLTIDIDRVVAAALCTLSSPPSS